ncbi:MAG: hypothetical protein QOG64_2377, partial [Acidimicrobiaceae bacterium]|nr:hypothetical protein [Acidimicrobiaceae bacterium]
HVRHEPPFRLRPWAVTAAGRDSRVGQQLDCPLCDRAELPDHLARVRTAGPFDATTLPAGLRREHRVAASTWAVLQVSAGEARLVIATDPPIDRILAAGGQQPIPPEVPHRLSVNEEAVVSIEFLAPR